jgi:hypothetical protein
MAWDIPMRARRADFSYFFYIPTHPLGATMYLNEGH